MLPIIEVRNLSKIYKIYSKPQDKLFEIFFRKSKAFLKKALDNVSFEVFKGEAFGIIGENGAGKSTLLSIIAGINKPTKGNVVVRGKVASILELGSGFHPELTGIENIFLYGSFMGMSESFIKKKLDFIKNFSELHDYLDKPLKTYSTGMIMRLAFSTILALEPDIFIIDEALAVGDLYFQKKVFNKIREFKEKGGTILFTSHSMYQITNLCERALWLKEGKIVKIGSALEVAQEYENYIREKEGIKESYEEETSLNEKNENKGVNFSPAWIDSIRINKKDIEPGDTLVIDIKVRSRERVRTHIGVLFRRNDKEEIALYSTKHEGIEIEIDQEEVVEFIFEDFPILYGNYYIEVYLTDENGNVFYDVKVEEIAVRKTSFLDIGVCKIKGTILVGQHSLRG